MAELPYKPNYPAIIQSGFSADAGFHAETNMKMVTEEGIDDYVADILFRKRDPRFADVDRY